LWDETQRLNEQVAALQERLALYEDVEFEGSSSTRLTTLKAQARREEDTDVWNVWPYSWAIGAANFFSIRFHSFHENLNEWRMTRRNRKEQVEFWQQPHPEDISLKLL
jgi:hypothetical protein